MATRRKRPIPESWATAETISEFSPTDLSKAGLPGSHALAIDSTGDLALFGGADGVAVVYSISKKKVSKNIKFGAGSVTAALFWDSKPVIALSTGAVKVFEKGKEIANFEVHDGAATGLSLHPSGELLASVGEDKSYVIYDLTSFAQVTRVFTNSGMSSFTQGFNPSTNSPRIIDRPLSPRWPPFRRRWHYWRDLALRRQIQRSTGHFLHFGPCHGPLFLRERHLACFGLRWQHQRLGLGSPQGQHDQDTRRRQ